jgi:hypothetical protein
MKLRPIRLILIVGTLLVGAQGYFSYLNQIDHLEDTYTIKRPPAQKLGAQASSAPAPQATSAHGPVAKSHAPASTGTSWDLFREKYGQSLEAEFLPDGRLVAIHGSPMASSASGDFNPKNADQTADRAREILDAAADLLGLQKELPLANPRTQTGEVSAQAFFSETLNGAEIAPQGGVSVDLGPHGELLGLDSSYVPGIQTSNSVNLSPEDATRSVEGAEGSRLVVWVLSPGAKPPEGRYAYDVSAHGMRVVVDAQTGQVIVKRDRRNY